MRRIQHWVRSLTQADQYVVRVAVELFHPERQGGVSAGGVRALRRPDGDSSLPRASAARR